MSRYPRMLEELLSAHGSAHPTRDAAEHLAAQRKLIKTGDGRIAHPAWPSFVGMSPTDVVEAVKTADPGEAVYEAGREYALELVPKLDRAATRDTLTGLLNRRGLEQRIGMLPDEARQSEAAYVVIDLDHFKRANDEGIDGHATGDEVLGQVAAQLSSNLRPSDLIARYGGEEFVVVLPYTSLDSAAVVMDRLRNELPGVVGYRRRVLDDESRPGSEPFHQQTMSVGIAPLDLDDAGGLESAARAADCAVYAAKEGGRDRTYVVQHGEPKPYLGSE